MKKLVAAICVAAALLGGGFFVFGSQQPRKLKYTMVVYSPTGEEVPGLQKSGTDIINTPYGGATLVVSEEHRIPLSLQKFPSGASVEIIENDTGKVVLEKKY